MKNKLFLSSLFLACLLTGCTDEWKSEADGTMVTVNIAVGGMNVTRATVDDTESEGKITTLDVYLVETTSKDVTKLASGTGPGTFNWKSAYSQAEMTLPSAGDEWLLYAVANCPSDLTLSTTSYEAFMGAYTAATPASLWADNSFLMVNSQRDLTSSSTNKGGTLLKRTDKTLSLTVERVAAKIVPSLDEDIVYKPVGLILDGKDGIQKISQMEVQDVALIGCANQFNLIQQWKAGTLTGEKMLVSPSSSTSYDISTGYYNRVGTDVLTYKSMGSSLYCLENNSPYYTTLGGTNPDATADTKMKGRVTGLLFRARAVLVDGVSTTEDLNSKKGPYGWYVDPTSAPGTRSLTLGDGEAYKTFYGYKGNYYADSETLKAAYSELSTCSSTSDFRTAGVSVYEDGYVYYTYFIKDANYTDNGEPFFNVTRNTQYNVVVTEVTGLGDDVPGGNWTATDPITVNGPLMTAKLTVSDWTVKDPYHHTLTE